MADHMILQKVDIYVGGYKNITKHLGKRCNFVYIDPPYRPLSGSACFIEYTHNIFDDTEQEKLKTYFMIPSRNQILYSYELSVARESK